MLQQALLKGGRCGDELPLARAVRLPSSVLWDAIAAVKHYENSPVETWEFGGWEMQCLGKGPLFCFSGCPTLFQTPAVGSMKSWDRGMVEKGGRRSRGSKHPACAYAAGWGRGRQAVQVSSSCCKAPSPGKYFPSSDLVSRIIWFGIWDSGV